jgi:hypothetical protein
MVVMVSTVMDLVELGSGICESASKVVVINAGFTGVWLTRLVGIMPRYSDYLKLY